MGMQSAEHDYSLRQRPFLTLHVNVAVWIVVACVWYSRSQTVLHGKHGAQIAQSPTDVYDVSLYDVSH